GEGAGRRLGAVGREGAGQAQAHEVLREEKARRLRGERRFAGEEAKPLRDERSRERERAGLAGEEGPRDPGLGLGDLRRGAAVAPEDGVSERRARGVERQERVLLAGEPEGGDPALDGRRDLAEDGAGRGPP